MAFGSDGMPMDPLYGIASAVTHPNPSQRMTFAAAIGCYTMGGAFAAFAEADCGRIAPGYWADLVVLAADPTRVDASDISSMAVAATIISGGFVHGAVR